MLPGGPLRISWPDRGGSVFMTGPAEAVFDGVLIPELVPAPTETSPSQLAATAPMAETTNQGDDAEVPTLNCSRDCRDGCRQPDQCLRAEAQQQVQSLLDSMSLDTMIDLAADSLEQRTRARISKGPGG